MAVEVRGIGNAAQATSRAAQRRRRQIRQYRIAGGTRRPMGSLTRLCIHPTSKADVIGLKRGLAASSAASDSTYSVSPRRPVLRNRVDPWNSLPKSRARFAATVAAGQAISGIWKPRRRRLGHLAALRESRFTTGPKTCGGWRHRDALSVGISSRRRARGSVDAGGSAAGYRDCAPAGGLQERVVCRDDGVR